MQRSQINTIIDDAKAFFDRFNVVLPPFADWTLDDWHKQGAAAERVVARGLGWDITDFGLGRFDEMGLFLFTVRNGDPADLEIGRGMLYAEKAMIARQDQLTPMHYHKVKAEDIINRGGATLCIQLNETLADGRVDDARTVRVYCDGVPREVAPGAVIRLAPGESVTLMPLTAHAFWAEGGDVYIGEVSTVNDDKTDNYFIEPVGRFPSISDDVAPTHLLVCDYDQYLSL